MKILVTGRNGQVGFELQRALAPLGEVIAVGHGNCNLTDVEAIRELVRRVAPDVIVNPAAYTAVDKAEADEATAFAVNARAPGVLGEEAARLGALVVHFSTDYVFSGSKDGHYSEDDQPDPQSVYGSTKYAGEVALVRANPRHLIMRTSWVVGAHGGNFAKTMLRLAAEREQLNVVADQFGAPTSAAVLADLTAHLVRQYQRKGADGFPYGTYHVAASGETSWCDYARFVIGEALTAGQALKASPETVMPLTTAQYPTPAKRPANSRLDTSRFRNTFGLRLPPWQESVRHVLQQIF
ncbi:dTDP-4-dehydrorhamnose reductase [Massilia sp. BSC265]|uniref:dTDP-4-dehydrorhamnose reductase n=1 Tax=Massilia sp. BSC265 TaxID=1549812 RepID=UPI0004E8DFA9|nr:dTDP-4-dehydrorhamnose reductase [Massilia sp. BSC265]KFI08765.1 dTDP-4-dehydrorhamnose reductase [Massilia sp. BSC265]